MSEENKKENPPTDADRQPNNIIQSDDRRVMALARQIATEDQIQNQDRDQKIWRLAVALEKLVYQRIKKRGLSQAFATAAEVAESLEGDCTEHAVLLAALARARGIPARVTVGLAYAPSEAGFGFHMWNEVWIKDRWIPLDAMLGKGGIGGGHLKLAHSSLDGASPLTCVLPVLQVIGQMEIEVLETE